MSTKYKFQHLHISDDKKKKKKKKSYDYDKIITNTIFLLMFFSIIFLFIQ